MSTGRRYDLLMRKVAIAESQKLKGMVTVSRE